MSNDINELVIKYRTHFFSSQRHIIEELVLRLLKSTGRDLLFAQLVEHSPVFVVDSEPLTVPRPDVHIDGTEVVVLLMPWSPCPRDLHVQLH